MKIKKTIEFTYTWEQVKKILAAGKAREEFGLGGEFTIVVDGIVEAVMRIVDFDRERVLIPGKKHNMTVMFRDLIFEEKPFDEDGKNVWRTSSLRAKLNSVEFINLFEKEFRELFVPVLKENSDGIDTEDIFFLASMDELKDEKKQYAFFKTERQYAKVNEEEDTYWRWTRSAKSGIASYAWFVDGRDFTSSAGVRNENHLVPLVVLAA